MSIKPISLKCKYWDEGYALDIHTISSTFDYYDDSGRPHFINQYSYLGQAVHDYKYEHDKVALEKIMGEIIQFFEKWDSVKNIDAVIPVPPSNKRRQWQPVFEVAKRIAKHLNAKYSNQLLLNTTSIEAKEQLKKEQSIVYNQDKKLKNRYTFLIVDDLYNTGQTLMRCAQLLHENNCANGVFALTITKTRKRGLK